jgi:hypothetical protein
MLEALKEGLFDHSRLIMKFLWEEILQSLKKGMK